jgi:TRAP-type transport system small permease protein
VTRSPENRATAAIAKFALIAGSAGLFLAMLADALAVLGRHAGFAILGSIEIVQMSAVVAISAAIVLATLDQCHAAVHLVTERVSPRSRALLGRVQHWLEAAGFAVLCAGAVWIVIDHWQTHEETDLLHIPMVEFRVFWIVCAGISCGYSLWLAFARGSADER